MPGLTKAHLVAQITVEGGGDLTRQATARLVDGVFTAIRDAVATEGRFGWTTFGTLVKSRRRARRAKSAAGRELIVPETVTVRFRPSPRLRKSLRARTDVQSR